jgi:hypothetical protein
MTDEVRRTHAMCAYAPGPDGHLLVDCAVSQLRVPGTDLPCVCIDELKEVEDG